MQENGLCVNDNVTLAFVSSRKDKERAGKCAHRMTSKTPLRLLAAVVTSVLLGFFLNAQHSFKNHKESVKLNMKITKKVFLDKYFIGSGICLLSTWNLAHSTETKFLISFNIN